MGIGFLAKRKAYPPLGARVEVSDGVGVVVTRNHRNRTAPGGWMVQLGEPIFGVRRSFFVAG